MQTLAAVAAEAIIELERLAAEGRPPRDQVDAAARGAQAVQGRSRPAQYLDAVVMRRIAQLQRAAGHLHAVIQPGDRPETARGKVIGQRWRSDAGQTGGMLDGGGQRAVAPLLDRSCADDIDAARRFPSSQPELRSAAAHGAQRIVAPGGAAASTVSCSSHPVALRALSQSAAKASGAVSAPPTQAARHKDFLGVTRRRRVVLMWSIPVVK